MSKAILQPIKTCERCDVLPDKHPTCEMCGKPECSLIPIDDDDMAVGYHATVLMCSACSERFEER